jgi:hypothetical protein
MQLNNVCTLTRSEWKPGKCRRHKFSITAFPCADLGRVNAVLLQLRHRHFFADRFKRNLGFEIGRVVLFRFVILIISSQAIDPP